MSVNIYDMVDTWNNPGTVFTAIKMNVTNTACAAGSKLLDLQFGGVTVLAVDRDGVATGFFRDSGNGVGFTTHSLRDVGESRWVMYRGSFYGAAGAIQFGSGVLLNWCSSANFDVANIDAALGRNAAGVLEVNSGAAGVLRDLKLRNMVGQAGFSEMVEMAAPAAPAANMVRIYAEDNGSGKTRLMALFPSGAAQQIAIEP
jgi:hypothetical protein